MKKLTASNETESNKPKQGPDMRSIDMEGANKKPGVGSRFTKIGGNGGGGGGAPAGGSRFKKVGVAVAGKDGLSYEAVDVKKEEDADMKVGNVPTMVEVGVPAAAAMPGAQTEIKTKEDTVMAEDDEEEAITWEEYDFTRPTGCDHPSCPGCKTDGIWGGEWVAVGTA
jgi:hypothetical protein